MKRILSDIWCWLRMGVRDFCNWLDDGRTMARRWFVPALTPEQQQAAIAAHIREHELACFEISGANSTTRGEP